jgi:purine nucleosidase
LTQERQKVKNIIIDTDTGSDDAVALVMALRDPSVKVMAITTVAGNVEVNQATHNALQSIDYANTYKPSVYQGISKPLVCELEDAAQVHGLDGMGDFGFREPVQKVETEHAVDALIRLIGESNGDIELITLGPLTNIATAILQAPDVMKKVPHITIMGGAHFYSNPHSACAEFNIMTDPEAADIVCKFGIPITMITLEACQSNQAALDKDDIGWFRDAGETAAFCMDCNKTAIDLTKKAFGHEMLELPDPVAYAVFSNPALIKTSFNAQTIIELGGNYTRGTTIFRLRVGFFETVELRINSKIVTEVHGDAFKDFMYTLVKG